MMGGGHGLCCRGGRGRGGPYRKIHGGLYRTMNVIPEPEIITAVPPLVHG